MSMIVVGIPAYKSKYFWVKKNQVKPNPTSATAVLNT